MHRHSHRAREVRIWSEGHHTRVRVYLIQPIRCGESRQRTVRRNLCLIKHGRCRIINITQLHRFSLQRLVRIRRLRVISQHDNNLSHTLLTRSRRIVIRIRRRNHRWSVGCRGFLTELVSNRIRHTISNTSEACFRIKRDRAIAIRRICSFTGNNNFRRRTVRGRLTGSTQRHRRLH